MLQVDVEMKICSWSSRIALKCLLCVFFQLKTSCWLARSMGSFWIKGNCHKVISSWISTLTDMTAQFAIAFCLNHLMNGHFFRNRFMSCNRVLFYSYSSKRLIIHQPLVVIPTLPFRRHVWCSSQHCEQVNAWEQFSLPSEGPLGVICRYLCASGTLMLRSSGALVSVLLLYCVSDPRKRWTGPLGTTAQLQQWA